MIETGVVNECCCFETCNGCSELKYVIFKGKDLNFQIQTIVDKSKVKKTRGMIRHKAQNNTVGNYAFSSDNCKNYNKNFQHNATCTYDFRVQSPVRDFNSILNKKVITVAPFEHKE